MEWKSLANAITHKNVEMVVPRIFIGCERCGCPHMFRISEERAEPINNMEDIILETRYFLKCPECGFEEADQIITVIPSWQWHPIRNKFSVRSNKIGIMDTEEYYKEKIPLAKTWMGGDK